jgi:hypothetical protein
VTLAEFRLHFGSKTTSLGFRDSKKAKTSFAKGSKRREIRG